MASPTLDEDEVKIEPGGLVTNVSESLQVEALSEAWQVFADFENCFFPEEKPLPPISKFLAEWERRLSLAVSLGCQYSDRTLAFKLAHHCRLSEEGMLRLLVMHVTGRSEDVPRTCEASENVKEQSAKLQDGSDMHCIESDHLEKSQGHAEKFPPANEEPGGLDGQSRARQNPLGDIEEVGKKASLLRSVKTYLMQRDSVGQSIGRADSSLVSSGKVKSEYAEDLEVAEHSTNHLSLEKEGSQVSDSPGLLDIVEFGNHGCSEAVPAASNLPQIKEENAIRKKQEIPLKRDGLHLTAGGQFLSPAAPERPPPKGCRRSRSRKPSEHCSSLDVSPYDPDPDSDGRKEVRRKIRKPAKKVEAKEKIHPICNVCGKIFTSTSSLNTHLRIHSNERPFQCESCGESFPRKDALRNHERHHTGERPFKCDQCDKSFCQKGNLNIHLKIHEKVMPYQCDVCNAQFFDKRSMKRHTLVHLKVKPFACETCGKEFTYKHALKIHIRIHTGEKPFVCKECSKAFTRKHHLLVHTKIHLNERRQVGLTINL